MPRLTPAQIRLVSRRYQALQGFATAADGVVLLSLAVGFWTVIATERWRFASATFLLWVGCLVVRQWRVRPWLREYYTRRFGRVASSGAASAALVVMWMQNGVFGAAVLYEMHVPWRGALTGLMLAGPATLLLIQDRFQRPHWIVVLATAIGLSLACPSGPDLVAVSRWQALAFATIGCSLIFAGLMDHLLLVRLLGRGRTPDEEAEAAERS